MKYFIYHKTTGDIFGPLAGFWTEAAAHEYLTLWAEVPAEYVITREHH